MSEADGDIIKGIDNDPSHVVVGFFTPNYRELTERFSANLSEFDLAHHFFAISATDWQSAILLKPKIVGRARALYPGKSIVLMDVDCIVRGTLDPLFESTQNCDIALTLRVKHGLEPRDKKPCDRVWSSSRLVIWRPTDAADSLLKSWTSNCATPINLWSGDEGFLLRAISQTPNLRLQTIPKEYGAWEICDIGPEAIVIHQSQRATTVPSFKRLRRRAVELVVRKPYAEWRYRRPG
jgi:hypothetical protein